MITCADIAKAQKTTDSTLRTYPAKCASEAKTPLAILNRRTEHKERMYTPRRAAAGTGASPADTPHMMLRAYSIDAC